MKISLKHGLILAMLAAAQPLSGCSDDTGGANRPKNNNRADQGPDLSDPNADCRDLDGDGHFAGLNCPRATDCDDNNPQINPDAQEVCGDRVDNNCNDQIDESCPCSPGALRLCSSHGDPMALQGPEVRCKPGVQRCVQGAWQETCEGEVGPSAESCNRIDDDCDGVADNGVRNALGLCLSDLPDGWTPPREDCGPTGEGNGLDDNGDGQIDEGCSCAVPDYDPNLARKGQPCYGGPPSTLGVGVCKGGARDCVGGAWGTCAGQVLPSAEVCGDGLDNDCDGIIDNGCPTCVPDGPETCDGKDNDCDGLIDEGVRNACGGCGPVQPQEICGNGLDDNCDGRVDESCQCTASQQPCYAGPPEVAGVGACARGRQQCGGEFFGECVGSVLPQLEQCNPDGSPNGIDEDCDGQVDEGCGCPEGATRQCGSNTGVCRYGTQTCSAGVWGDCSGGQGPTEAQETSCDGQDNDCDGLTDEGLLNACGRCGQSCYTQPGDPSRGSTEEGSAFIPAGDPDNPQNRDGVTLSKTSFIPPYLWAANHTHNTVSKFNTDLNQEEGIYYVAVNPSRTAVDLDGNMWVGGRDDGRLTKVIWDLSKCIDRNGNGVIDTSRSVGGMPPSPVNSMADPLADECVEFSAVVDPNPSKSIRGIAAGPDGRVWIGFTSGGVRSIDAAAPHTLGPFHPSNQVPDYAPDANGVLQPVMVHGQHRLGNAGGVYGLAVDARGMLYLSSFNRNSIARFNTMTNTWEANLTGFDCGSYGIATDGKNRVWTGGWPGCPGIGMYDPSTNRFYNFMVAPNAVATPNATVGVDMGPMPSFLCNENNPRRQFCITGVGIEPATGDIWTSFYPIGYTGRLKLNENDLAQSQWQLIATTRDANNAMLPGVGVDLRGVGFDRNGFAWTLGLGSDRVWKIDPATNTRESGLPMGRSIGVGSHYTYSDFTGSQALNFTAPRGVWRYIFDTKFAGARADRLIMEAHAPAGTAVQARIRPLDAANSPIGPWQPAADYFNYVNGQPQTIIDLSGMGLDVRGERFEMEVRLTTNDPNVRPILYRLDLDWQRP